MHTNFEQGMKWRIAVYSIIIKHIVLALYIMIFSDLGDCVAFYIQRNVQILKTFAKNLTKVVLTSEVGQKSTSCNLKELSMKRTKLNTQKIGISASTNLNTASTIFFSVNCCLFQLDLKELHRNVFSHSFTTELHITTAQQSGIMEDGGVPQ